MKKKICFRADAGQSIGYGHFIRTLALADMLKNDFDCVFYTQSPTEYQISELNKVCAYVSLPADDSKFQLFLDALSGDEIVVLDNYFFTTDYQRRIRGKGCKLVCIDDMHDKHYVADAIINHGPVTIDNFDCEPYTKLALGFNYALLRKPFLLPLSGKKRKESVVLNFGGSDPCRLTDKVVSLLLSINPQFDIIIILGDKTYLSAINRDKVKILKKLSAIQMANLFETSSFGILPNSTVSLEAASRGLPLLVGFYVDNQIEAYYKFIKDKRFVPLGDLRCININVLRSAIEGLQSFQPPQNDYSTVPFNFLKLFHSLL